MCVKELTRCHCLVCRTARKVGLGKWQRQVTTFVQTLTCQTTNQWRDEFLYICMFAQVTDFNALEWKKKPCSMVDSGSMAVSGSLKGGRDYISPQKAIYKWYISGTYCQLGDYMLPTTF